MAAAARSARWERRRCGGLCTSNTGGHVGGSSLSFTPRAVFIMSEYSSVCRAAAGQQDEG